MLTLGSILQLGNGAIIREKRIVTSEASSPKCQASLASHTDPIPASNCWGHMMPSLPLATTALLQIRMLLQLGRELERQGQKRYDRTNRSFPFTRL
jgi:hypothetical protein